MVMNCFPFDDNLVELRLKIIFKRAKTFGIFQRMVLAWANNLVAKGEDTPKYFPHAVRFELKIAVPLLLTEEKRKAIFWPTAQIKHWWGCRCFWKAFVGGQERWIFRCHYCHGWRNYMRKMAGSPLEIQINLAYRFPKSIPTLNSLSEIAWSSWQRTLLWTLQLSQSLRKRGRAMAILQSKILNNSSFRNRKTILTGGCCSENHSRSCHSLAINPSLKLILIWDFPLLL